MLQALGIQLPSEDTVAIGSVEVVDPRGRVLTRGNPDEVLPDPPSVTVHRSDLHRALLAACAAVPLETGRLVTGVQPQPDGVAVAFEGRSEERWDLVIGADGIRSTLRRSVAGSDDASLRYSGQTCWRFALEAPDLVPAVSVERWGLGRRAGLIPLSRGRIYVYLVENAPQGTVKSGSASADVVRAKFSGMDEVLDAALERLDAPINHDDLCDRDVAFFGAGRVVLIGDAAHPMTPNAGQGACTAIEDAGVIALLLARDACEPGVLAQELATLRRERVEAVQRLAWRVGRIAHWRNPVLRFLRDLAIRSTPQRAVDGQARALWQPGLAIAEQLRALPALAGGSEASPRPAASAARG